MFLEEVMIDLQGARVDLVFDLRGRLWIGKTDLWCLGGHGMVSRDKGVGL